MNMLGKNRTHFLDSREDGLYLTIEYFEKQVFSKEVLRNKEKKYYKGESETFHYRSIYLVLIFLTSN